MNLPKASFENLKKGKSKTGQAYLRSTKRKEKKMYQNRCDSPHRSINYENYERACPFYGGNVWWTREAETRSMEVLIRQNKVGYGGGFEIYDMDVWTDEMWEMWWTHIMLTGKEIEC